MNLDRFNGAEPEDDEIFPQVDEDEPFDFEERHMEWCAERDKQQD